jgi:Domain of unknown function (DUF4124)
MLRITIALAALAGVVGTAYADVYKTIDAQGQVHYSDRWTPGAVLIKGDIPPPASSAPAAAANNSAAPDDSTKAAAAKVQADVEAARAEQCKELKDQYAKVIRARRIYQPSADGTADSSAPKQYMTDAEADAERVRTREAMDEACAGQPGG